MQRDDTMFRKCFRAVDDDALASAIAAGRVAAVRRALARGADLTRESVDGTLPLTAAVKATDPVFVKMLLERGAPVRARADEALVTACRRGRARAALLLLDRGADVHAQSGRPLLEAARFGHLDVVAILLLRGAIPRPGIVREAAGHSRDAARIVQLLVRFGARSPADELGDVLLDARRMHDHRRVRDLLRLGADPAIPADRDGEAMCAAIATGDVQLLRLLLENDRCDR